MALVHSRVRRVVFGIADKDMGGLGGAAESTDSQNTGIHTLPGTNHHYRAFKLNIDNSDDNDEETRTLIKSIIKLSS